MQPHRDTEIGIADWLDGQLVHKGVQVVRAPAEDCELPSACATVVYGKAMLSVQMPNRRSASYLKPCACSLPVGGTGSASCAFGPPGISQDRRREIAGVMSKEIHVGVQPLCQNEWTALLERHGLKPVWIGEAAMDFLEPRCVRRSRIT